LLNVANPHTTCKGVSPRAEVHSR